MLPDRMKHKVVALQVLAVVGKIHPDSCSDVNPPLLPPIG